MKRSISSDSIRSQGAREDVPDVPSQSFGVRLTTICQRMHATTQKITVICEDILMSCVAIGRKKREHTMRKSIDAARREIA